MVMEISVFAITIVFHVKKAVSSHRKGEIIIIAGDDIAEKRLKNVIEEAGYKVVNIKKETFEKKGLFSRLKKQS